MEWIITALYPNDDGSRTLDISWGEAQCAETYVLNIKKSSDGSYYGLRHSYPTANDPPLETPHYPYAFEWCDEPLISVDIWGVNQVGVRGLGKTIDGIECR